jgi:hypothetical protein
MSPAHRERLEDYLTRSWPYWVGAFAMAPESASHAVWVAYHESVAQQQLDCPMRREELVDLFGEPPTDSGAELAQTFLSMRASTGR